MNVWCQVVVLVAVFATTDHQQTDPVWNFSGCPGDTLTLQCSVQSDSLLWKCDDGNNRYVLCINQDILPMMCHGVKINITRDGDCDTSDEIIINSTAKFIVPTNTITLTCGGNTYTSNVPIHAPSVQHLHINDTKESTDDANLRIVTISWKETAIGHQTVYAITVEPAVRECNGTCTTNKTYLEMTLAIGTEYNVIITTVVCNGSLQSTKSEPFPVLLNMPLSVESCNVTTIPVGKLVQHMLQWSLLKDSLHLYYNLTYNVDGEILMQTILPMNCSSVCSYNITEDSATDFFVMGVNDVGPGDGILCNMSFYPSTNIVTEESLFWVLVGIIVLLVALLLLCAYLLYGYAKEDIKGRVSKRRVQQRYIKIKAAFEASQRKLGTSLMKMEAGRSVVYKSDIYFAPYNSHNIFSYSVDNDQWRTLQGKMHYCNSGLAIIDECVAAIGGQKGDQPTNEVWVWKDQQWVQYNSMEHKRSDPAVVTSSDYNYVVAVSGNVRTNVVVPWTSSVEVYGVIELSWKSVGALPSPHTGIEVTLCKGTVYVFPDQYKKGFKCTLEDLLSSAHDQSEVWESIKGSPLRFSTPATIDDCVVCVGGVNEKKCGLDEIHIYDETTNSWNKIEGYLKVGRMYSMVEVYNRTVIVVGGIRKLTDERDMSNRLDTVDIFHLT